MDRWQVDIQDWQKANKDIVKYALEEGKVRLLHTVELAERISSRGFVLISLMVPIIGLFVWSVYGKYANSQLSKSVDIDLNALIWGFSPVVMLCILTVLLIFPRKRSAKGNLPSHILTSEIVGFKNEKSYLSLLIGKCESIDQAIKYNSLSNPNH